MSFLQIGRYANNTDFHARCRGAVIDLSAAIIAAQTASGSLQDDAANDLTTTACQNWCKNYLKGTVQATDQIIASYMLQNSTVAASPFSETANDDAGFNWQLKHVFLQLVSLG